MGVKKCKSIVELIVITVFLNNLYNLLKSLVPNYLFVISGSAVQIRPWAPCIFKHLLICESFRRTRRATRACRRRNKMLSPEEQEAVDRWVKSSGLQQSGASTKETTGTQACQGSTSQGCWFSRIIEKITGRTKK